MLASIQRAPGFTVPAAEGGRERADTFYEGIGWGQFRESAESTSTLYHPMENDPLLGVRYDFAGPDFNWAAAGFGHTDEEYRSMRRNRSLPGLRLPIIAYTGVILKLPNKEAIEEVWTKLIDSRYSRHLILAGLPEQQTEDPKVAEAYRRVYEKATLDLTIVDPFNQAVTLASFTHPQVAGNVPPVQHG